MSDLNVKARMLGGTLVIAPDQRVVFQRRETKRFEHVTPAEVLEVCKRLGSSPAITPSAAASGTDNE